MRLFIAIELPVSHKDTLTEARVNIPGARWVPTEQIHLTLAFLGEIDEDTTKRLVAELKQIEAVTFDLILTGAGCFPDRHRPRVLWVGAKTDPALSLLAAKVKIAALSCGIKLEDRPFSPHITLARLKYPPSQPLDEYFVKYKELSLSAFTVSEFTLFQSKLSPMGATHIPIAIFPLKHQLVSEGL